jgi:hypothetical protein
LNEIERKAHTMIPANADSPSIILRSTHILHMRLDAAQPGEWSHHPSGWMERRADLALTLIEILKGATGEAPGQQFQLTVIQLTGGPLSMVPAPGVWSDKPLDPGVEMVAFCRGQGALAAELLTEPACERLLPAAGALADVRLAREIESGRPTLSEAVDRAVRAEASLHDVFIEYLWARWENEALREPQSFELVMRLLETPGLGYIARATLLNLVLGDVLSGKASAPLANRLAVALFRLIEVKEAASLHDNIIGTFLPNLLALHADMASKKAADVFKEYPNERAKTEETLRSYQGEVSTTELLEWLAS